jgi:hypothetical protein
MLADERARTCGALSQAARRKAQGIIEKHKAMSQELDRITEHGSHRF